MFRREMGSKRGSLPPKEGDLTCMHLQVLMYVTDTKMFGQNRQNVCAMLDVSIIDNHRSM